jgi:hypothetical protein
MALNKDFFAEMNFSASEQQIEFARMSPHVNIAISDVGILEHIKRLRGERKKVRRKLMSEAVHVNNHLRDAGHPDLCAARRYNLSNAVKLNVNSLDEINLSQIVEASEMLVRQARGLECLVAFHATKERYFQRFDEMMEIETKIQQLLVDDQGHPEFSSSLYREMALENYRSRREKILVQMINEIA